MSQIQIAERYAKSLIELAQEQNKLAQVSEDVLSLEAVCNHKEFAAMLQSPVINSDKKSAIFKQLFTDNMDTLSYQFIQLLLLKGRESLLPSICSAFIQQYRTIRKIRIARVLSATVLNEAELVNIKNRFSAWLKPGETMELHQKLEPTLIGGFIFEMGDQNCDASIKRQLEEMKESLYDKSYISLVEKR
ncbi:MAG: ATP synthase F1 subunit delta [Saprospiraceae bacterium]|nr:ATP synthase F1 subunit delta [Saprospiraceae bacterium]MBK6861923.1 ATP synthase F1 subunit delta [Saprospiraceae bacterium]